MSCRDYERMISLLLDGRLAEASIEELRLHLGRCAECQVLYRRLRSLNEQVEGLERPVPAAELAEKIRQRIASSQADQEHERWVIGWKPVPLLATVVVMALVIGNLAGDSLSPIIIKDRHAQQVELLVTENGQSFSDAILEISNTETSR
ncbi:MAG: zf-HC2 domain-containing protein [Deltaproteobacteria bacterium]|nr:zf-HC2 domain-containing protein [Deltaproteobacteria bacterium]